MFNSLNRKQKVVSLYLVSIVFIAAYWFMENSSKLNDFLESAHRARVDWGFGFYAIIGFIKFGLLTAGIAILITLTTTLIVKKKQVKR